MVSAQVDHPYCSVLVHYRQLVGRLYHTAAEGRDLVPARHTSNPEITRCPRQRRR